MSFTTDTLITSNNIHSFNYDYQLSDVVASKQIDDGYNIYMWGSSATFAISVISSGLFDDRCNIACYKASSNNQWLLLGRTSLDRNQNYGFTFNCETASGANAFPEQAIFGWEINSEYQDMSHGSGNIILTLRDKEYTIAISSGESILSKIESTLNSQSDSTWYGKRNGDAINICKRTASYSAGSGFIINMSSIGITSGYYIYSEGTNVSTGIVNYSDFDCARWRITIEIPYQTQILGITFGDKRIWAKYRVNSYNTPTSQNQQTFIDNNFKFYQIYQWTQSLGKIYKGASKSPDEFATKNIVSPSSAIISSSNYMDFTIRGRY